MNPTCELTFGEDKPAVGWLLGDTHAGIRQMFEILKRFRMLVGVKSMATISTGYLNAKDYAVGRTQGASLVRSAANEASAAVPIIDHPDVRRSLMTNKTPPRALVPWSCTPGPSRTCSRSRAKGVIDPQADVRHQLLQAVINVESLVRRPGGASAARSSGPSRQPQGLSSGRRDLRPMSAPTQARRLKA